MLGQRPGAPTPPGTLTHLLRAVTQQQQTRLVAVASLVTGAARLLAQDPGTAIEHGELDRMWALLDHAIA